MSKQKQDDKLYIGRFVEKLKTEKEMKKRYIHPIFLYTPNMERDDEFDHLNQIVNVYEHTLEDFIFNAKKIIKHYRKYLGDTSVGMFTIGQSIRLRVYKGQEPIDLPLFRFFVNYTMLIAPVLLGVDLHNWKPMESQEWTPKAWNLKINQYIKKCRPYGNNRQIDEYLEWSKYLMNLFAATCGDLFALSISNHEFREVAKRDKDAYESMTCTFPIPKGIAPSELETMLKNRTSKLLDTISEQTDLSISTYTRNGLFNPGQFKEFAVHIGFKPDLYGNTIPMTSKTNIMMGLNSPLAYMTDAYGGRKAEIIKLYVSDAGALERSLCMLLSRVRYVDTEYECNSRHFRTRFIDSIDVLEKLEGRVCTLDPDSDEFYILDPDDTRFVGKTVYLKTPITCTHPRRNEGYICSACYGKLMANLNRDIHIGRLTALNSADDMEQKLLSAKHALATNTNDVKFDEIFDSYFVTYSCQISFNQAMIDASQDDPEEFKHLFLEFHLANMKKSQDGEGRSFDRSIPEIVIYNDQDDSRIVIREENGMPIYLSPEFNEYFLAASKHTEEKGTVLIPFTDLIDTGKVCCEVLFEYQYKNNEIADALLQLEDILTNGSRINSFETYDECLSTIIPLFIKGGIHLPEFQQELLISQMIFSPDGSTVDWEEKNPEYRFYSIDKSIQNNPSATTSVLYHESSRQLAGAYHTYDKTEPSAYDEFIYDGKQKY